MRIVGCTLDAFGRTYFAPPDMDHYFVPTQVNGDVMPMRVTEIKHGIGYLHAGYRHILWVSEQQVEMEVAPCQD